MIEDEQSWKLIKKHKPSNSTTYKKYLKGSPIPIFKCEALGKGIRKDVIEKLILNSEMRKEWDKKF